MGVLLQGEVRFLVDSSLKKINSLLDVKKSKILYINMTSNECNYDYDVINDINLINEEMINFYDCIIVNSDNFSNLFNFINSAKKDYILEFIQNNKLYVGMGLGAEILSDISYYIDAEYNVDEYLGLNVINSLNVFSLPVHNDLTTCLKLKQSYFDLSEFSETILLNKDSIYISEGVYNNLSKKNIDVLDYFNVINIGFHQEFSLDDSYNIKDEFDLMNLMNEKLFYGWADINQKLHLNNLNEFKINYKIMSNELALNTGLATCIESANIINEYLINIGYETKLLVDRIVSLNNQVLKIHLIVLFEKDGNWFQFEHSNKEKRGIKLIKSIDEFIKELYCSNLNDVRIIPNIPVNISYNEFNDYINTFDLEIGFNELKPRR